MPDTVTVSNPFFDHPILNSPYEYPRRHWELDPSGQPTQRIMPSRRRAAFITPIPKPKKRKKKGAGQAEMVFDEGKGLSSKGQQYDPTSIINEVRQNVDAWRALPHPSQWQVTPETARLLQHWRHHRFGDVRPFFCQVEAVETAIWLTEVAPQTRNGKRLLDHLEAANKDNNPELSRLALKLATGAGKTTVMSMLIAWQTVNAVRHSGSTARTPGTMAFTEFRIADTFTDSLRRLTGDEQKAAKNTAFDLQINPANPGMQFHRLDRAKDKNFWSVRVSSDIRIIVHRTAGSLLLCYVDHHDKAYDWAERRKLETHPTTGAAQFVEIRERVKEIVVPTYVSAASPASTPQAPLFADVGDDQLLGYGVPVEWLADVRRATEDSLLSLADHLPAEAAEALLELATGGKPRVQPEVHAAMTLDMAVPTLGAQVPDPFEHPDAQRRFRTVTNVEELQRALDFPWEKWTIFLHPDQRQWVERDYSGPARVSGSAGTGKTIVALHRAAHLARNNPDSRVLLATFSETLASALRTRLTRLVGNEPRLAERIDVYSLDALGLRLYKPQFGSATVAGRDAVRDLLRDASQAVGGHKFSLYFLLTEWEQIVDAWHLESWEAYRDVARLGRKTRLPEAQRKILWSIFERVRTGLKARNLITQAALFTALAGVMARGGKAPFDFAVVDEAQDLGVAHLRFFAALGGKRRNALFFAGDLGQRIFQQPFSWKSLGVDIRGRSRTLRVNYRTSHQIRTQADRLLGPELTDVDGNTEYRGDTVSVFNGPPPTIQVLASETEEAATVGEWLKGRIREGMQPHEVGVFVRSAAQLPRAESAVRASGLAFKILDEHVATIAGHLSIGTMHLAKGLEFRGVAVMACDDEVLPLQERIESVGDDADLQEVYDTERHLLYVACTRARDHLLITAVAPASEYLDDLKARTTKTGGRP
ncbi:MAG TPA: UvrD-helicase domain-containing protein [Stellaceae bacterium]|nr:UvrD-helicase domain-containing protein [Stellaceae bacterium]